MRTQCPQALCLLHSSLDRFPPPRIFTNALLGNHEITTLIRDTEPHERALFSLDPSAVNRNRESNTRRLTTADNSSHGRKSLFPPAHPMKPSAITRLLGNEMLQEIRQSSSNTARARDGVNVEVLLRGAEKLSDAYAVDGVLDRIRALRNRHRDVSASISTLEEKVSRQQSLLARRNLGMNSEENEAEPDEGNEVQTPEENDALTEEAFQLEEEEVRELEVRKKALEERVSGMERDLGGLLR